MVQIEWNAPGTRTFEAGVGRGVLYPKLGPGVPWNGLISVSESVVGGEVEAGYYEAVKYADFVSYEDFQATLEAYSAPPEFALCDGTRQLSPGLFVSQQPRQSFGLSYQTLIGNDLEGIDYGYKIHIVYNCTAAPSGRNNQTISGNVSPGTRSWTLHTVPPPASYFKPTAHIVLDSTLIDPYSMQQVEGILYGHVNGSPRLPSVSELVAVLDSKITEFVTEFI